MKRFIAIAGLLMLACQIALGGAGSLFVCLCESEAEHSRPCEVAASCGENETGSDCSVDDTCEASLACHGCADILIEASQIETVHRGDTPAGGKEIAASPQRVSIFPDSPPRALAPVARPDGSGEKIDGGGASRFARSVRFLL